MFDGIVAAAPGFSLPRAALAQTWDTQTFAKLWNPANGKLTPTSFTALFSEADFAIVRDAVIKSCDGLDGLADGMINAFGRCTSARVLPALRAKACTAAGAPGNACIAPAKIGALHRSLGGPRDASGRALYAEWPWDTGIGTFGWSLWKLGSAQMPSLNILTGGASLPSVFMVPPKAVGMAPEDLLAFQMAFRFPEDAKSIYATSRVFPRSAWQDIAMRSSNLDRFRAHGGKLIVPHGVSDPVFSINDTLRWQREVNQRYRGKADQLVRVFPVPGMAHCGGGPATDQFDAFAALTHWVEDGKAPELIAAKAGAQTPWPGRSRPLCAYPKVAVYDGHGPINDLGSFQCTKQP
ncbi:tannase/feruloyl esterase family alpha/beta hydrolase (plasmid) [Novosphingobium rhizosphaerae]